MPAVTRLTAMLLLSVGLIASSVPAAIAAPVAEEQLEQEISDADAQQDLLEDDLDGAQAELNALEAEFQLLVDDYNTASEELATLEAEIANKEEEVKRYEAQAATARSEVGRSARGLYVDGVPGGLPGLVGGEGSSDLSRRLTLVEAARTSRLRAAEAYAAESARYEAGIDLLEDAYAEADDKRAELVALQTEIEDKVEGQRDDIARLEAEIARQAELRAAREERLVAVRAERARQEAADRAEREAAEKVAAEQAAAEQAAAEKAAAEKAAAAKKKAAEEASSKGAIAVKTALAQIGKPYRWGGSGPSSFDCSGLTSYAWRAAGVSLPHNSRMQYNATKRVSKSDLQPGDLLFFYSPISHVGMYIGDGKMVDAPYSGKTVRVRSIFRGNFAGAGRPRY